MPSLLRLKPSETKKASHLLARALYDYPLFCSLLPDPQQRTQHLPILTGYLVRAGMLYGSVYTTSPNMEGVAVWLPPQTKVSLLELLFRVGVITCPYHFGFKAFQGIWNYVQHIEDISQRYINGDYWYLQVIGIDYPYQRQGYGQHLIRPMLAQFSQQQIPCCLDTEEESTVNYYQRYGFKVVDASPIPGTNNTCWFMLKEP